MALIQFIDGPRKGMEIFTPGRGDAPVELLVPIEGRDPIDYDKYDKPVRAAASKHVYRRVTAEVPKDIRYPLYHYTYAGVR